MSFTLNERFEEVSLSFTSLVGILRTTFSGDPEVLKTLDLKRRRERIRAAFFAQAGSLFSTLITKPDIPAKVAHLELTAENLQLSVNEIVELQGMNEQYAFIKGEL